MASKYSFKLIFLKFIFECLKNTAPHASSNVYVREKCLKCNNFAGSIIQRQCGPVIWVFFEHFSLFSFRFFFFTFFPFRLFCFILTADLFWLREVFCDNVFLVRQNKTYRGRSYRFIKLFKITTEHCNSHL